MTAQTFNAFCDQSFAELLSLSPEVAGELGITQLGGRRIPQDGFSDISADGAAARMRLMRATLAALEAYDCSALDEEQRLSYQVYREFLRTAHFGRLRGTQAEPAIHCDQLLNHLNGVQAEIITCLTEWHSFSDIESLDDYLSRLASIPDVLAELRLQLDDRLASGQRVPGCLLMRVRREIEAWLDTDIPESSLYQRFFEGLEQVGCDARTARRLQEQARELLETGVFPAYRQLLAYLEDSYPHSEQRIGLCRLPDGPGYYEYLLNASTTTKLSPQQIHERGKSELANLQENLAQELAREGYGGDSFAAQLSAFEADPRFRIPPNEAREDLLRRAEAVIAAVRDPFLETVGIKPQGQVVVRPIPEHQEANRHSLYTPGSTDGSRPGIFYLNLSHLKGQSVHGLATLTYHETFPGHHVQLTIAQELGESLPEFRKVLVHDAYIEGWAKYAEVLPWLEKFNTDPCWNLSRKRNELISTANLVLDTGIHHFGWSREQGVEFFIDNTASGREFAEMIVDRIVAVPAQVCAYKIGMMTVLTARERMQRALGTGFDLREFHDEVLRHGSIPLSILDELIDKAILKSASQTYSAG